MSHRSQRLLVVLLGLGLLGLAPLLYAQWGRSRRNRPSTLEEYRESIDFPQWTVDKGFTQDTFTFVRVRYDSGGGGRGWGGGGWRTDWPDSDLNFSLRLQQLTAIRVNPDPIILDLTDERLFDYPFLYMIEPGRITLYNEEALALRRYCLNGGFLLVDDFWGAYQYDAFRRAMKQVFPDREAIDLPLSHEIFHCVYDLDEQPQVPSINWAGSGITWEDHGPDSQQVHYRAIVDDDERIMVMICHNTDLGDGWEREGENQDYFEQFSVKKAYPLGINIVTYAMTH